MAAALSFASASQAESATAAAPQLASPALAVKAGRQRGLTCGVVGICEHGRRRYRCKDCGGSSQEIVVLDATAVEVDEDAEPDEWIPTVQSYIVVAAGPRDGKRKR